MNIRFGFLKLLLAAGFSIFALPAYCSAENPSVANPLASVKTTGSKPPEQKKPESQLNLRIAASSEARADSLLSTWEKEFASIKQGDKKDQKWLATMDENFHKYYEQLRLSTAALRNDKLTTQELEKAAQLTRQGEEELVNFVVVLGVRAISLDDIPLLVVNIKNASKRLDESWTDSITALNSSSASKLFEKNFEANGRQHINLLTDMCKSADGFLELGELEMARIQMGQAMITYNWITNHIQAVHSVIASQKEPQR